MRATCTRLRDLVRVLPAAIIEEHANVLESATHSYQNALMTRLPRTLHTAIISPRNATDFGVFASLDWPQLKILRIAQDSLDTRTPVRAAFLQQLPVRLSLSF